MKKYLFALSFSFILIPSGVTFAAMVYTDPLYGVTEAINAQTMVLKDALTQQQMATLPVSCVQRLRADIAANDTYIRDTEKMIADLNAKNAGKAFSPEEEMSNASTINHLYTLISVQKQRYTNEIIRICSQEKQQTLQPANSAPTQALTLDQQCKNSFGIHSIGYGATKCVCETGYHWASDGKSCAPALGTNAVSISVSSAEKCKATYGSHSKLTTLFGNTICGCEIGYVMSGNTCVTASYSAQTPLPANCDASGYCWGAGGSGGIVGSPAKQLAAVSHSIDMSQIDETTSTSPEVAGISTSSPKYKGLRAYVVDIWSWFSGLFGR